MTIDAVYATCKSVTVTKKGVHVVLNAENGNFPSDVTRFAGEIVKLAADDRPELPTHMGETPIEEEARKNARPEGNVIVPQEESVTVHEEEGDY